MTCALQDNNRAKCWGKNQHGELGLDDSLARGGMPGETGHTLPSLDVGTGLTVGAIEAGDTHTCAIVLDGLGVKCWGNNHYGQLGYGDLLSRGGGGSAGDMGDSLPLVSLGTGRSAVALALGHDHTCALLDNGLLKCWGRNDHGQLGLEDTTHRGGSPGDMGDHLPFLNLTNAGTRAVAVAAGYYHTCAVMDVSGGQLKCWGYNANRQLGQGTTTDVFGKVAGHMGDALPYVLLGAGRHVVAVAAGVQHTCALLDNGRVRCFGNNQYGQLGARQTYDRLSY